MTAIPPYLTSADITRMTHADSEQDKADLFIRALLALARMNQIIPLHPQNQDDSDLRDAINEVGHNFGNAEGNNVWASHTFEEMQGMLSRLNVANTRACIARDEAISDEYMFLYSSLVLFTCKIRFRAPHPPQHDFGSIGLHTALAETIGEAVDVMTPNFFRDLEVLIEMKNGGVRVSPSFVSQLVARHATEICDLVEDYIWGLASTNINLDVRSSGDIVSGILGVVHERLGALVQETLQDLVDHWGSLEDRQVNHVKWNSLVETITWFFSYSSPLLSSFSSSPVRESLRAPAQFAQFAALYERHSVDRRSTREVNPNLQAVELAEAERRPIVTLNDEWYGIEDSADEFDAYVQVAGLPEVGRRSVVTLDDVSFVMANTENVECAICYDTHVTMRKMRKCVHAFGAECLTAQLNTNHPNRYKCAYCRKPFF